MDNHCAYFDKINFSEHQLLFSIDVYYETGLSRISYAVNDWDWVILLFFKRSIQRGVLSKHLYEAHRVKGWVTIHFIIPWFKN